MDIEFRKAEEDDWEEPEGDIEPEGDEEVEEEYDEE